MSYTFKKLGIEYTTYSKDQIDDALQSIQQMRLEQILVGECEPFDWNNVIQRPELIECKDPNKMSPNNFKFGEDEENTTLAKNSYFIFTQDSVLRMNITKVLNQNIFQTFMLITATLNVVAFCITDQNHSMPTINRISIGLEILCNCTFGIEMMLKSIAYGLVFEKNTYLREKWNVVNLITFFCTWAIIPSYSGSTGTIISILKTIRLLRVFRFLQEIPILKIQLDAYIGSFVQLGTIIVPLVFVMLYFSVVGLHLFMGLTEKRCRLTPEPVDGVWEASTAVLKLCGIWDCPEGLYCGSPADYGLPRNETENDYEAFTWDFTKFDNFFNSVFVVFTFLNVTGWSGTTFMFWRAMNTYITAMYFLILIVLLAFILSNLLLATFYESFMVQSSIKANQSTAKQEEKEMEDEIQKKKKQQMMDRLAAMSKKRRNRLKQQSQNQNFSLYFDNTVKSQKKLTIHLSNLSNKLSKSIYFIILNSLMIVLCSLTIVIDYDGINVNFAETLSIIDFICTIYFFIELSIQILGKGFTKYLKKSVNKLDIMVVISQLILYAILFTINEPLIINDNRIIQLFKALKILRLLKFLYSAKLFYNISILTRCALETILKLKNILLLWIAIVLLVALIGRELLSDIQEDQSINIYYTDFGSSLMAAFNIFYNEEWHITMYRYARKTPLSIIFYVLSIVLGQVFFIRLLTAVFLNEFGKQLQTIEQSVKPVEYKKTAQQIYQTIKNITMPKQNKGKVKQSQTSLMSRSRVENNIRQGINRNLRVNKRLTKINVECQFNSQLILQQNDEIIKEEDDEQKAQEQDSLKPVSPQELNYVNQPIDRNSSISINLQKQVSPNTVNNSGSNNINNNNINNNQQQTPRMVQSQKIIKQKSIFNNGLSLFMFSMDHKLRMRIINMIETTYVRYFSLLIVLVTSIRIALVNPLLDPTSDLSYSLKIIYILTTIYYSVLIVLNIIAYGFFMGKDSFICKTPYNIINFVITIVEIIAISTNPHQIYNFFSSLRILEFLRIGAEVNNSIRYAQSALMNAFVKMIQLSLFFFIILMIYGTFAMKLLKGYNYYCAGVASDYVHLIETKFDCLDYGGSWINQILGFDNVFDSALTLFVTATTEAWLPILVQTWSARGQDLIPINNHNRWWAIYFQIFFFIGNICMLNMFIGLIVNTYQDAKLKAQGLFDLDENQREWYRIKCSIYQLIPKVKSKRPDNIIRRICFVLVKNKFLKKVWLIIIFINTVTLSLYYHRQDETFRYILSIVNSICIILYAIEILSRFIAKTFRIYFKEITNLIDIIGIWICLADIFIVDQITTHFQFTRCFGAFSVAFQMTRNFRIIKRFNQLEKLFQSIFSVIPSALSIIYIMFIFLFIYTNLGMDMLAYLRPQEYINGFDLHFQKFTTAMFSLVRVASSEQWWALLVDAVHPRTANFACLNIDTYEDFQLNGFNGCGTAYAYVFFISFHLIFSLVILNLFIASLLGAYEEHVKQEACAVSKYQLNDVLSLWAQYDDEGSGFLNYKQFWKLSSEVALIFGVSSNDLLNPSNKKNFLKALNIQLFEDKNGLIGYLFHDVILSLTRISVILKYGVSNLEPNDQQQNAQIQMHENYKNYTLTPFNSGHMAAIIYIQSKVRVLINKKKGGKFLRIEDLKLALQELEKEENKQNKK